MSSSEAGPSAGPSTSTGTTTTTTTNDPSNILPSVTTTPPSPPPPRVDNREPTPDPPPHPGGGYGLGEEEPKPLTLRPINPSIDLDPTGRNYLTILRLITDSIAQQSKVLSRHVVLHPPLLRPFSDNLRVDLLPIPPVVIAFLGITVFVFMRLLNGKGGMAVALGKLGGDGGAAADQSGGGGGVGWLEAGMRTLCYMGAGGFVYLSIVERIVAIYGGFTDRASSVAKTGLNSALGIPPPPPTSSSSSSTPPSSIKGYVHEWGDEIVALIFYQKHPPGRSPITGKVENRTRIEIKAFTVKLMYRGQGLGTGLLERVLDEEMKYGEGGRKVDITWAEDCVNGYAFVPRWLAGGLDVQWERVTGRVRRMVEERERDWVGRDRGKKRE